MTWSRATKLVVVASTIVAGLGELYFAAPGWRAMVPFTIIATLIAAGAAVYARALAMRAILFVIFLAPATFLFIHGDNHPSYECTWLLPLMALVLVDRPPSLKLRRASLDWSIPAPWRIPLAWWALVVSVSWPIIFLREVDFSRWVLDIQNMPNSSAGTSPDLVLLWTLYVVIGHNLGILWIDALYRWYGTTNLPVFRREVIVPLVAGSAIACAVGVYQATVDLGFLSGHVWPSMLRAAGTLMDANAFGMIVAMMGPAAVALAMRQGSRASITLSAISLSVAFAGVWTSGSRSALAALLASTAAMAFGLWQESHHETTRPAGNRRPLIAAAIIGVTIVLGLLILNSTTTIVDRVHSLIPGLGDTTVASSVTSLWQRFGYGSAAMRMIAEHPFEGIGAGMFHTLIMDYRVLVSDLFIGPDNAQNWYRHALAEFGILGALPMLIWTVIFAKRLFARSAPGTDRFSSWAIASPLVAFGLISLLSVPGQSVAVIITFWTLAFWFLQLQGPEPAASAAREPAWAWLAIVVLVIAHAGLTLSAAYGSLLPQHRAARWGWAYTGGMSRLEPNADGTPGRRFANLRSLSTIPVKGKTLKFVAWIDHPDGNEHPVHVRVRADGKDYFEGDLRRPPEVIRLDIPATPGATEMIVETWIDRTFRPSQVDPTSHDRRDLGLSVRDWVWE